MSHIYLHSQEGEWKEIEDRTNNALESYNGQVGERLKTHPDMHSFVRSILDESLRTIKRMQRIRQGHEVRDGFDNKPFIPEIPVEYHDYVPPVKADDDDKKKKGKKGKKGKK